MPIGSATTQGPGAAAFGRTLSIRPLNQAPGRGGQAPDARLLNAAIDAQKTRVITDIIDTSIQRSREAREQRQEREQDDAVIADRDARRAELEAEAARADRRREENRRAAIESDARREQTLAGLGEVVDIYA
ncbi:MAG: hypothetical protein CMJ31_09770 [Phycisphaerae bacterium]|nr:hypothetical protein [Phycisphaerae bacterium]